MEVLTLKRSGDKTFPEREATMQMKVMGVNGGDFDAVHT